MIKLIDIHGNASVLAVEDFYIREKWDGRDELVLSIPVDHPQFRDLAEEARLEYEQPYMVRKIDGSGTATVTCELDLDELRASLTVKYSNQSNSPASTIQSVLPTGWTLTDHTAITTRRTISLDAATPLDVIEAVCAMWSIVPRYDVKNRNINLYNPAAYTPAGAFLLRNLNMSSLSYKGKTSDMVTRLYCEGKDGLTFESINNGLPYVEDHTYSSRIICAYWKDERYTVKESLLADAQKKLAILAVPEVSYDCTVTDLQALNPELYSFQDLSVLQVVQLADETRNRMVQHQVVERKRWPNYPEKNEVTLSTVPPKITSQVKSIQAEIKDQSSSVMWASLLASLERAADTITGATDGYIRFRYNANGEFSEILCMDTNDESTAQKVLRLNYAGWALSTTGVDGPYSYALTADDGLNASQIKVGILQGIQAILESGKIGGWDIESNWIKKDFQGHDASGNARTIRTALTSPAADSSWVLYSMYTINDVMYPMFVIKADGSAQFRKLDGLVVGEETAHKNSFLHGALTVDDMAYLNDSATVNGTLFLNYNGSATGRIAATGGDMMYFGGTDSDHWVMLGKWGSHWGFMPWTDVYLDLGHSGKRWDNIYTQNGVIQTSDRRQKKSIKDLPKKAMDFIRQIKPVSFLMKTGKSGRRHWGFVAQDVESAMEATGITAESFAGLIKDDEGWYGLRYEEFVAPLTMMVQDLDKRVEKLERMVGT